jgi:acetoin utilization deacetylase AcuC-like enzyme
VNVGLVYDPIYLEHDTGSHPENASRLTKTVDHLKHTGTMKQLVRISPRAATVGELSTVHTPTYISDVESFAQRGGGFLDPDTIVSPASYNVALYAAGGLIEAVNAVMAGNVESAFALVRPPGHHAFRWEATGFCLFNNIAIAARYAITNYNLERILIADFDVHHGNGTQDTFYDDPHVLYFCTHQSPWYPGSGRVEETGDGDGKGTTVNVPLPAWCSDDEYLRVYDGILIPLARRFRPQLVLVSAGYDAHWSDPLAQMQLSVTGFANVMHLLKELAEELCDDRIVLTLEGGYNLDALAASTRATIDVLLGNPEIIDPIGKNPGARAAPDIEALLEVVKGTHGLA